MPDTPALVAACWTTAGDFTPGSPDGESPVDLTLRVKTAAAAGFTGLGLNLPDLTAARARYGDAAIRALLADHGLERLELELLTDWYATGAPRTTSDARREALLDAAAALGAQVIKIAGRIGGTSFDPDLVAADLHRLAGEASAAGARLALEPSPLFDLATPEQALDVVERAGHPAAGVLLDNWAVARAGVPVTALRTFPAHRIAAVELSDAPATPGPDLVADCFERGVPGSGELDVPGFAGALRAAGYEGPWGVEVLASSHRRRPVTEAVPAAAAAARRVLGAA